MTLLSRLAASAIKTGLRATFKLPGTLPLPLSLLRRGMAQGRHGLRIRREAGISSDSTGGVPGLLITPPGPASAVILHLHGGAFFAGSPRTHRRLAAQLAQTLQADVFVPDYRLAPEHPWPAAHQDALAVWQALLAQGYDPAHLMIAGDSAGGGLALGLAIAARDLGQPPPLALLLISPFIDLTLSSDAMHSLAGRDPVLSAALLRRAVGWYRYDLGNDDPRLSPLHADLAGLPPILVQVGSEEILLDDALTLETRVRAVGGCIECQVWPGLWHDFHLLGDELSETALALDAMVRFISAVRAGENPCLR